MGLLNQSDRQYYLGKKSFTATAGQLAFTVSDYESDYHPHHQNAATKLNNPAVKVYIDGNLYLQRIVNDAAPSTVTIRWKFLWDADINYWHILFHDSYLPETGAIVDVEVDDKYWLDSQGITQEVKSYQVTSLENIINNFMIAYTGEDKIISKINRTDVQFHAMRGLQEMSFDTFKSCKSQEIEIPPSLTMALPKDYVNYVKLSWKDNSGIKRTIYPSTSTSNPFPIKQDSEGYYEFNDTNDNGDKDIPSTRTDTHNLIIDKDSDTWSAYKSLTSTDTSDEDKSGRGTRYGLNPQTSNANGVYFIDCARGVINFSSSLNGLTVVLDYISDSLGTDGEMVVHKFAEEAMYKWIMYAIMSTKSGVQEYVVQRYKKEKTASIRQAKLRLSNIKLEEITQVLRGKSKFIKH